MEFSDLIAIALIAFGVACLLWLTLGRLLLPTVCDIRAIVPCDGSGDGLEHTVRGLVWLRRSGLWRGVVVIRDVGLNRDGLELAQRLAAQDGVELERP